MSESTLDERGVIAEALTILSKHMEPAKVAKVIAALQWDGTDYVEFRRKLFANTSVDELFEQIQALKGKKQG
jgi:hypothetical protein